MATSALKLATCKRVTRTSTSLLCLLLLVFLPTVSQGASEKDECNIEHLEQRRISPTSVTIAWSQHCPEDKLTRYKFYVRHKEFQACDDKSKTIKRRIISETNVTAREKTIDELHPFSRYTIELVAVVRQGNRNSALKRELEVISPQEPPTLKVSNLEVVEHEATMLAFSWTPIPLEDPRVLLDQARCEQFQSRLGQLHYKMTDVSEGVIVREGKLSLTATSLEVDNLNAGSEYSLSIFATNPEGQFSQSAGSTVTGRTLAAAHDVTMVVVGVIVGLLVIIILVAVYLFLRRRGLAQRRKPIPQGETGVYSAERPILRTPQRADVVRPYSDNSLSGRKSMEDRPLPPRPGKPEPIYQEIPANGTKAPLAKEEEEEYDEAKYDDGEETGFLQPRVPTPSSVTEEDEDGYLKPNFHRFQSTEKGDDDGVPAPIPMISYGSSQDPLRT